MITQSELTEWKALLATLQKPYPVAYTAGLSPLDRLITAIPQLLAEIERLTQERDEARHDGGAEAERRGRALQATEDAGIAAMVELFDGDRLKNSDPRKTIAAALTAGADRLEEGGLAREPVPQKTPPID